MKSKDWVILVLALVLIVFVIGGSGMMGFWGSEYTCPMYSGLSEKSGSGYGMMFIWILLIIALFLFVLWIINQVSNKERKNKK